ncbi:hypothetical protein CWM52_24975 [Raoultella sp. T31]|nr:hypothetical protein CWM52_24975 [Raoultella sp. T31]
MYDRPNARKGRYLKIHNMLISVAEPEIHEVKDLWRLFNIIYIMRTNDKDGRIWRESLTLAVNGLLSTMIQNHPFLQTNQNQMSVSSK